MNYYDELGIGRDASVEEIRQAYKQLARLLHPDVHSDANLKALAECQMRRLGEIAAILVDPQKRRQYDNSLLRADALTVPVKHLEPPIETAGIHNWIGTTELRQFAVRYWFWVLMAMAVAGFGIWTAVDRAPDPRVATLTDTSPRSDRPADPGQSQSVQETRTRRNLKRRPDASVTPQTDAGSPTVQPLSVPMEAPVPIAGPYANETLPLNSPAPGVPHEQQDVFRTSEVQPPPAAKESVFAGRWLYSPEAGDPTDTTQYAAQYVELVLVEQGGTLTGDYRARYEIPDQPVSPEVVFHADGEAAVNSAALLWTSPGGAKGKAELKLEKPGLMRLRWWTTEFGTQATLASGMAVLVRQRRP
jgi:hypothetical protein